MAKNQSSHETRKRSAEKRRDTPQSSDLNQELREADPITNLKSGLESLGLHRPGLDTVSRDSLVKLGGLVAQPGKRAQLITSMWNAVASTAPDKLGRLVDVMHGYSGSVTILETFLLQVGNWNPFLAAERAQILVLPASEGTARGASGHILTGITYCAYDRALPVTTTGYISGKQAITKIFEAFNPDRVTDGARAHVRARRHEAVRQALQDFNPRDLTLADLEENPSLAGELRSRVISRNLTVYDELRAAIEQCKSQLSQLVYGGALVLPAINSMRVGHDSGRQFYGWFEDHFRENPNVPVGIKVAFESLRDEDVELSQEEEAYYIRGLLAYQRMHSFINKSVALDGLVSDLSEYEQLASEDPLHSSAAVDQARQSLKITIGNTGTDISFAEFSSLLENAAMVQFRHEMNSRILSVYREELLSALSHFEFVSFEGGKWREDSLADSVPMERLKRHLYGAKVGVANQTDGADKKRALLAQSDFRHIMDAQFLWRLVTDEDKLLNAKPVAEFRSMVEGVIVAYRKARFLEARLEEYKRTPAGAMLEFAREDVGAALQSWTPVLPMGGSYRPAEAWEKADPHLTTLSLQEVSLRVRDLRDEVVPATGRSRLRDQFLKVQVEAEQFAPAGLYLPAMNDLWRELEVRVRDFTPVSQVEELINRAARLHAHPMVELWDSQLARTLTRRYLSPAALRSVYEFLKLEKDLEEICQGHEVHDLAALRSRLGGLNNAYLYQGDDSRNQRGRGQISLTGVGFSDFAEAFHKRGESYRGVTIYQPKQLGEAIGRVERDFVSLRELGDEWVARAKKLCSSAGKSVLSAHNFNLVDDNTYRMAQGLYAHGGGLVNRAFVAVVDRLLPPPQGAER